MGPSNIRYWSEKVQFVWSIANIHYLQDCKKRLFIQTDLTSRMPQCETQLS